MSIPTHEQQPGNDHVFSVVHLLEKGDGWAHVLVSVLLLLLAIGILVSSTISFGNSVAHPESVIVKSEGGAASDAPRAISEGGEKTPPPLTSAEVFVSKGLVYLSDLLFGVIVLELLSTILTYIKARNLEATIKDFLIVGLISSVRKILLVGAQSSLESSAGPDGYVKEATGTVITIIGIVMLVGGLLLLDRRKKAAKVVEEIEL